MLDQDFAEGFATAILVLLEPHGDRLDATVAAAGHPPAIVVRPDGTVEEFGEGALLGMYEGTRSEDVLTELRGGDALVLYTDGLSEAHAPERLISVSEMTAPLTRRPPRSAQQVVQALLRSIAPGGEVRDDIAILAALARPQPGQSNGAGPTDWGSTERKPFGGRFAPGAREAGDVTLERHGVRPAR
jgi:serine phosphatase RsbU (regulator of sigma subunit)